MKRGVAAPQALKGQRRPPSVWAVLLLLASISFLLGVTWLVLARP